MKDAEVLAQPRAGFIDRLPRVGSGLVNWLLLVAILGLLIAAPIGFLVRVSFEEPATGAFTFANYAEAYGRPRYIQALINSLILGVSTSLVCVVLAVPMAWGVSRTNMPFKWLAWAAVLGAFILPPYLTTIGWILIAGPNSGWLNTSWVWLTGAQTPLLNIYTFTGIVLVTSLNAFPFIFLFVKSSLDMISTEMEEAAAILGSPPWYTSLRITLPLAWPALLGGVIIVFLESIALLGVPALLGIPARVGLVTTQLMQFFGSPIRLEVAAAFAMPLLFITITLIYVQRLLLARKGYVTQSGKGSERREIDLGRWKWLLTGWCLLVGMLAIYLPGYTLLAASFAKSWAAGLSLSTFTLGNYYDALIGHSLARAAIVNSFTYGLWAGLIAVAIALWTAYVTTRKLVPLPGLLSFLCMAPFVIPGIVLAIGFYAAYASPPLSLYGTAALLVLAFAARFLPTAFGTASAGTRSINPEMEEAVRILGGTRMTAIRHVVAPLLKKTLFGAFLLVFIPATRELSAAIFLVSPHTRVVSVLIYDMTEESRFELVSALGCIVLLTTSLLIWLGYKIVGRDFMVRSN